MRLYHGTDAFGAERIPADGFTLDFPETDSRVWLTDSRELAATYGDFVLEVEATFSNPAQVVYGEFRFANEKEHDAVIVLYPDGHRRLAGGFAGPVRIVTTPDPSLLRVVAVHAHS